MGGLRACVLAGNSIDRLPGNVDGLTSLELLDLRDNQLAALPDALGALGPSLQRLLLGRNRLAALPASLGGLSRLTHLHANWNRLEALPEELGGCAALVELQLSTNRLAQLPGTFSRLTRLRTCALQDNCLLLVPAVVGHMGQLTRLALQGNPWLRWGRGVWGLAQGPPRAVGNALWFTCCPRHWGKRGCGSRTRHRVSRNTRAVRGCSMMGPTDPDL
jgi:leucine-rich repeat protein SHOC2